MISQNASLHELRRELRASMGNRDKLSKLHTLITNRINHEDTYGEEKMLLLKFRQEVRDVLNCRVPVD